jgi:hypothetical protein
MKRKHWAADAGAIALLIVWTATAGVVEWWGIWTLNVDTSCDGPPMRTFGGGGWLAFAVPPVWAAAFAAVAVWRRGTWWWVAAGLAAVSALGLVLKVATVGPTQLCF